MTKEQYIEMVLRALGQMNHIESKVCCESKCEKCKHPHKKNHIIPHNGVMVMKVYERQKLIEEGHKFFKKEKKFDNVFEWEVLVEDLDRPEGERRTIYKCLGCNDNLFEDRLSFNRDESNDNKCIKCL